ncbi:ABC transporter permease [Sinomicrobium sp. M5D2P9]
MLKYNLKIAWRNLKKDRFYSLINIVGLAIASAAFLLIINFVKFEYSYEDFHEHADRIYRVTSEEYQGSQLITTDCETVPPLAPALKEKIPEVLDYVRVELMEDDNEIEYNNQIYRIDKIYAADPSIFDIFHHEFIQGDPSTALDAPMKAVVTESLAKRLFGNEPAKGKTVKNGEHLFTVTGVIKDSPPNTHLKIEMLLSFSSYTNMGWDLNSWEAANNYTYVLMAPNPDLEVFNRKLLHFSREKQKDPDPDNIAVAEPIKDIHLHSHKSWEPEVNGNIRTVRFLFITAFLILLIGSINYLNLATARASERAGEVGMRKVLGSNRRSLIGQFLTETLLINLTAMVLALLLIWGVLPFYFRLIGRPVEVDFFTTSMFWITCAGLFLFNCLLSGLYPAFNLSSARPASVVKRSFTGSREGNLFRKVLVVGQFAIALIVLSAAFIVFQQLSYMQNQDLGINTSETLVIRAPKFGTDSLRLAQSRAFKNELLQFTDVEKVSVSGSLPGISLHELSSTGITQHNSEKGKGYTYYLYSIDADFIPMMEIELAAGRNFRPGSVSLNELIINEEASRLLGFESPEKAVNQKVSVWFSKQAEIIGVIKDYHQQSLKEAVLPMVHWHSNRASFYAVKLRTKDIQKTVAGIGSAWKAQFPGHPFDFYFYDQMFNEQYKADQRFGKIVSVFSILTLFITCLGLLGLTAYTVSKRTKEIGIRKVLGASVSHIVALLSKDFIKLVLIAIIIASPIAWYAMNRWLENFAYRIELQWWIFIPTGIITVIVALATVSGQSIKAATANPVKSLRTE